MSVGAETRLASSASGRGKGGRGVSARSGTSSADTGRLIGSPAGFSIVELLVAMGIALSLTATALTLVQDVQFGFTRESERGDMQQRLRVAGDVIHRDLLMAGAGTSQSARLGPLGFFVPSVLPFRQGAQNAHPAGTFRADTLSILYVPGTTSAHATTRQPVSAASGAVPVNLGPGCPPGDSACGFAAGMDVIIYDDTASYDTFRIASVSGDWLQLRHDSIDTSHVYPIGATIVEAISHTYYLKTDAASDSSQLMRYDGAGSDVAVVDHVVALSFAYYGDPNPPLLVKPITDPIGPWTTYGPKPPPVDEQLSLYPTGENCAFQLDAVGLHVPRLPVLAGGLGTAPVGLMEGQLTDGPWCPDATNPHRFDADLLRIRKVDVTLRVESALSALRGPAGLLFTRGGTSRSGERWLPDFEVRFSVAPRNLN